jgi:pyridoxine 5-phosphate synthase
MTRLSVNINKVALLRNAREGNFPDLYAFARDCEAFGAQGITVHPRPDQRHIRYADLPILKDLVKTEFNIEGNPTSSFLDMVLAIRPHQCTLVPDSDDALTSDQGWNVRDNKVFLADICHKLKEAGIRSSVFIDPDPDQAIHAAEVGANAIELYTGDYALKYEKDRDNSIFMHRLAADAALSVGLIINAGHDLNLKNLQFYKQNIPELNEVSIGHALISDSLYYGIANSIQMYLALLQE